LHNPTPEVLAKIAQALGIAVGELYGVSSKNGMAAERKGSGLTREAQIQKIFRELPPKTASGSGACEGLKEGEAITFSATRLNRL